MIVTSQVYKNQDIMNGEGAWIISDAIKFSLSQIVLLTRLKLKNLGEKEVKGIRMICEGYKTRFTKPFQKITIEVPYNTGMDPYNGLLQVAVDMEIVEQKGSWYVFGEEKFQSKTFNQFAPDVLVECEAGREKFIEVVDGEIDNQGA